MNVSDGRPFPTTLAAKLHAGGVQMSVPPAGSNVHSLSDQGDSETGRLQPRQASTIAKINTTAGRTTRAMSTSPASIQIWCNQLSWSQMSSVLPGPTNGTGPGMPSGNVWVQWP